MAKRQVVLQEEHIRVMSPKATGFRAAKSCYEGHSAELLGCPNLISIQRRSHLLRLLVYATQYAHVCLFFFTIGKHVLRLTLYELIQFAYYIRFTYK